MAVALSGGGDGGGGDGGGGLGGGDTGGGGVGSGESGGSGGGGGGGGGGDGGSEGEGEVDAFAWHPSESTSRATRSVPAARRSETSEPAGMPVPSATHEQYLLSDIPAGRPLT